MSEDCPQDCLFTHEPGCTDCGRCSYCGRQIGKQEARDEHPRLEMYTVEHVQPQKIHGRTWVPACGSCNFSKRSTSLKSWLRYIRDDKPDLWERIRNYNLYDHYVENTISKTVREVNDE